MSAASSLGLHSCSTDLNALVPCVIKLGISSTSAVFEPRTTAAATTTFTRFHDGAALEAYRRDGRRHRRGYWVFICGHSSNKRTGKRSSVTI